MKLGMGVGIFFAYYLTCIAIYLIAPDVGAGHATLALLLPGIRRPDWPSCFLGFVESSAMCVALISASLYNYFAALKQT